MSATSLPRTVTLEELAEQRSLGWPTFHPEEYCHECGIRNVTCWFTASDLWNTAYASEDPTHDKIRCPQCFAQAYARATGVSYSCWEIRLSPAHQTGANDDTSS